MDATAGMRAGNRLLKEKSPYLLQHARNPVDWYPWGEEAFEKARLENRLIFLSIGYSTCHWCHVMEKESFEDEEAAALLNADYVAIKVDREERPDIDLVYMELCQKLTGSGGWPLNIIMTPDRDPIFAGTYIPKKTLYGRPGLTELLPKAADLWRQDPERLRDSGRTIAAELRKGREAPASGPIGHFHLQAATDILAKTFDASEGGFGGAPKFPTPAYLTFLLRRHRRTGDEKILKMAEETLLAMRRGGIYDQVGFGFHRYATDAAWLVPHFEKMLYDQAGIALAYLEAYQATGKNEYGRTVREIFDYLMRDMRSEEGGFYCGEDADSEGVEGKFYLWNFSEILEALGSGEGEFFAGIYGALEEGNYREEVSGEKTGANILHLSRPLEERAEGLKMSPEDLAQWLEKGRSKLLESREKRVRPHRDDKVLTAWNGLTISALARGGRALAEPAYIAAAEKAADFSLGVLRREDGRLLRRYREAEATIPAFAEDYAFFARGLLDLYEASLHPARLRQAIELAGDLERLFVEGGLLYDTGKDAEELVVRPRTVYDGAIPSAASAALELYGRLFLLTGDKDWSRRGHDLMAGLSADVARYPAGFSQLLQSASFLIEPAREVVIVGEAGAPDTEAMLEAIRSLYAPETAVLFRPVASGEIVELAPYTEKMVPVGGRATAYLCQDFACAKPIGDPQLLRQLLAETP